MNPNTRDTRDRYSSSATGSLDGDDPLRANRKAWRLRWQAGLVWLMLVVSLPMLGVALKRYLEFRTFFVSIS